MLTPWLILWNLACTPLLFAEEADTIDVPAYGELSPEDVRNAIQKAIEPLKQGSARSADEKNCFTCHNQALPVMALTEIAKRGFPIDQENLRRQLQHTWDHLDKGKIDYQAGKGQGGQVMTAGNAMWTLEAGDWKADELTATVTHYLIEYQRERIRFPARQRSVHFHHRNRLGRDGSRCDAAGIRSRVKHGWPEARQRSDELRIIFHFKAANPKPAFTTI